VKKKYVLVISCVFAIVASCFIRSNQFSKFMERRTLRKVANMACYDAVPDEVVRSLVLYELDETSDVEQKARIFVTLAALRQEASLVVSQKFLKDPLLGVVTDALFEKEGLQVSEVRRIINSGDVRNNLLLLSMVYFVCRDLHEDLVPELQEDFQTLLPVFREVSKIVEKVINE
jgi:hypothetical protein